METRSYRDRMGSLGDEYWRARLAHDADEAARIYALMGEELPDVPPVLTRLCGWSCDSLNEHTGEARYSGHVDDLHLAVEGWEYVEAFADEPYRRVWVKRGPVPRCEGSPGDVGAVLTLCEGDLTLEVFPLPVGRLSFGVALWNLALYYGPEFPAGTVVPSYGLVGHERPTTDIHGTQVPVYFPGQEGEGMGWRYVPVAALNQCPVSL